MGRGIKHLFQGGPVSHALEKRVVRRQKTAGGQMGASIFNRIRPILLAIPAHVNVHAP